MDETPEKPWILAINRLLKAEPRPNPRPKPGRTPTLKTWNQSDLAAAAGIGGTTLSQILSGRRLPEWSTLFALAKALGVPPAALLMEAQEAVDFHTFQQSRAQSKKTEAVEDTIRRVLNERGDEMKAAFVAQGTRVLLEAITAPPVPAPSPAEAKPQRKRSAR